MKTREIRQMSDEEVRSALEDVKAELFNLRFQVAAGKLEDYTRLRQLRRDVARCHTILRQRQLAAALVRQEEEDHA
jgi:large subunit ribosomal protein L29